jgi:uncharacterized protein YciI
MGLYAFYAKDGPQGAELRAAHRTGHMANMTRLDRAGALVFAGPLKDREGGVSIGSLIVFEAESEEAARRMMAEDPYTQAGVFQSMEVLPTLKAFPKG